MSELDLFLTNQLKTIEKQVLVDNYLYPLIGSIGDVFFSPYARNLDIKLEVLEQVWFYLLKIVKENNVLENRYDAIFVMFHIHIYIVNNNIYLPLEELSQWYHNHKNSNSLALKIPSFFILIINWI